MITYTNSTGTHTISDQGSGHATTVGGIFYGSSTGIAPGVAHIDNYDASGYFQAIISNVSSGTYTQPAQITGNGFVQDQVVNQSFIFTFQNPDTTSGSAQYSKAQVQTLQNYIDGLYDNFTNTHGTIFVSAVGNGSVESFNATSQINPPATAYNTISAGDTASTTGIGPTLDGRSKPDIVASGSETSYTTPLVAGAAAILVQAATGTNLSGSVPSGYVATDNWSQSPYTANAADERAIKALLLNGAVKPISWTHTSTQPLDPRYGSGVLNTDNSYQNLAAGRFGPSVADTSTSPQAVSALKSLEGWDFNTISTTPTTQDVNHYVFVLPDTAGSYTLTATLVWNVHTTGSVLTIPVNYGQASTIYPYATTTVNGYSETLDPIYLDLFNVSTGNLVAQSISSIDNVQQIFQSGLRLGQTYDLQVAGASTGYAQDSYALAFNFQPESTTVPDIASLDIFVGGLSASLSLLRRQTRR